jgi:hypothetical protein
MNLPKLYGMASGGADFFTALLAVKWLLLTVLGMLALGFIILYRKGNPIQSAESVEPPASQAPKAAKHARGRG